MDTQLDSSLNKCEGCKSRDEIIRTLAERIDKLERKDNIREFKKPLDKDD